MSEQVNLEFMANRLASLQAENETLRVRSEAEAVKGGSGGGESGGMDLMTYRLDQVDKRAEATDARMARVEDKLNAIQMTLAGLATQDAIRNWGIGIAALVVATGVSMAAIMLQAAGNQLSAFQSGLSAIQAVASAVQLPPAPRPPRPTDSSPADTTMPPPGFTLDPPRPANLSPPDKPALNIAPAKP